MSADILCRQCGKKASALDGLCTECYDKQQEGQDLLESF